MIDRVWWIWQMQDLGTRLTQVSGGTSMSGFGSKNGTLTDDQDFGWSGPKVKLGDLLNTMGGNSGKFCYNYV
jgi:tyrosinase